MFDIFIQYFQSLIEFLGAQLVIVLAYPLLPGQRIFWLYLCTSSLGWIIPQTPVKLSMCLHV